MKVTEAQREMVLQVIDDAIWRLRARLFGLKFKGPRMYFEIVKENNPLETLEGIFRWTYSMRNMVPELTLEQKHIDQLLNITGNYLDAQHLKLQNQIINALESAEDLKDLKGQLKESIEKTTTYFDGLIGNEARTVQSHAEKDSIVQIASQLGIEDPTVVKISRHDEKLCPVCKELWSDPVNPRLPRPYKMSELAGGYNTDRVNPVATVSISHPNCRCVTAFVPPSMTFGDNGQIKFHSFGFNYHKWYHNGKKED